MRTRRDDELFLAETLTENTNQPPELEWADVTIPKVRNRMLDPLNHRSESTTVLSQMYQ